MPILLTLSKRPAPRAASRSANTRAQMAPTVRHSTRASSHTALAVQRTARHAAHSSKSRVKREPWRAQGHLLDAHAVLGAARAAGSVPEVALGASEVHRAPEPRGRPGVVGGAPRAAHRAAQAPRPPRPHVDDDGLVRYFHGFHHVRASASTWRSILFTAPGPSS